MRPNVTISDSDARGGVLSGEGDGAAGGVVEGDDPAACPDAGVGSVVHAGAVRGAALAAEGDHSRRAERGAGPVIEYLERDRAGAVRAGPHHVDPAVGD